MESVHIPVLLQESVKILALQEGDTVVDCTLGLAGHAREFCKKIGSTGTLIGFDADNDNLVLAKKNLQSVSSSVKLHHANFSVLNSYNISSEAKIFADLGVSSLHFDLPERGFSHRFEGPLDMRFNRNAGKTCLELLRSVSEEQLEKLFVEYGELHRPKAFVRALLAAAQRIQTTTDLKKIIDDVYTFKAKQYYGQVFQALRIATNDELATLKALLDFCITQKFARIAIITFHSLEDRLVKHVFRQVCTDTKDELTGQSLGDATYDLLTKKPITPSEFELRLNPRSRSAKLRAITLRK